MKVILSDEYLKESFLEGVIEVLNYLVEEINND